MLLLDPKAPELIMMTLIESTKANGAIRKFDRSMLASAYQIQNTV